MRTLQSTAGPFALSAALLTILLSPLGCGGDGAGTSPEDSGGDKPQIALIMKSLANEFFSTMAEGAQRHQQESGEYELIVNGIKNETDLSRQVALVEEMVARGVDAIVIAPADSKALTPALKRAIDQGVTVVNIDNKLDDAVLADAGVSIPFVGPDNRAGARKVGEYVAERLSPGDEVVILEGIRTSFNGRQRRLGFEDAIEAASLNLVDSQSGQWEMSAANQISSAMLSEHPDVRAIFASNDSMALGALAAVRTAGKAGQVKVAGFDNIAAVRQAIQAGDIAATADQHGDRLAVFGIERALSILQGGAAPSDFETPVDLVTAETLR